MQYIKGALCRNYPNECFNETSSIALSLCYRNVQSHNLFTTNDKLPNDAFCSKTRAAKRLETSSVLVACISV